MRILRIANIPDNRTGGMSRYIHFVSDQLRADGHVVDHVFAGDLSPRGPAGRADRFVVPLRALAAVRRRLAAGAEYDVVEIHEPIAAAYALARRRSRSLPPLLVTVYALEARALQARLAYARLKGERPSLRSRLAPLSVVWQANLALRQADHVCVETAEDVEFLGRQLGVRADRVSVQHGGVDPAFFGPPKGPRAGVLFVGTWIERKGVRDLVPALTALLDRRPDVPVTLAGCGVPDDQVRDAFPARVRSRPRILSMVTKDAELAELYLSHTVFAFPSTFEGLPLAVLEAAAAGLGIVTTGTCGMKDFVEHEENGLLVPVADTAGLTAALARLIDDPALADRLGRAARDKARGYTWRRSADQFLTAAAAAARAGRGGEMAGVMLHFAKWAVGLAGPETQTTDAERACLVRHAVGRRRLAEIGVWHGVSTRLIRSAMAADGVLFAIDPYPVGRLGFSTQRVIAHRGVGRGHNGRVHWLETTGAAAAGDPAVRAAPIDFLFIDGDHSYDGLKADWEAWRDLIVAGGVVALHDSRPTPDRPIHDAGSVRYTAEAIRKDTQFELAEEVDSLTVIRRRPA